MLDFVIHYLSQGAIAAILLGVVVFLFQNLLIERLKSKLNVEGQLEVAVKNLQLKKNEDSHSEGVSYAANSALELQKAFYGKRVEAIDLLWSLVVDIKLAEFNSIYQSIDVLKKSDYKDPAKFAAQMSPQFDAHNMADVQAFLSEKIDSAYKVAPYIDHTLWLKFNSWSAIRSIVVNDLAFKREGVHWTESESIKSILNNVFKNDPEVLIFLDEPSSICTLLSYLEGLIRLEIFSFISGQKPMVDSASSFARAYHESDILAILDPSPSKNSINH